MKIENIKQAIVSLIDNYRGFNKPLSELINQDANTRMLEENNVAEIKESSFAGHLAIDYGNGIVLVEMGTNAFARATARLKRTNAGEWKLYIDDIAKDIYTPNEIMSDFQGAVEKISAAIEKDREDKKRRRTTNQEIADAWRKL